MLRLRLWALRNSFRQAPIKQGLALVMALGVAFLAYWGTAAFLDFLGRYPLAGPSVANAILNVLLLVLASAVILTALPNAFTILYTSEDLPFLLALPLAPWQVFSFKVLETFVITALIPALLLAPVIWAYGNFFGAPALFFLTVIPITLALFAFPVGMGVLLALPLMALAPAGRAREWAGGLSAVLGGLLILVIRGANPEAITTIDFANNEQVDQFLNQLWNPGTPFLPSVLASDAIEQMLAGGFPYAALWLLLSAVGFLALAGLASIRAYQAGWVRGLEGTVKEAPPRKPGWLERTVGSSGSVGMLWVRDIRLFVRDANQSSQLILVLVLVILYTTSLSAMPLTGRPFVLMVGYLHLAFQAFVIAGTGVRLAFPLYSMEGPGFWLVRTAPVAEWVVLVSRFGLSLALLLPLGLALGAWSPIVIGLPASLQSISIWAALAVVVLVAGLGVGLGAAFPKFDAENPAEVPMSTGGLLYMAISLILALLIAWIAARPVQQVLVQPGLDYLAGPEGLWWLSLLGMATLLPAGAALIFGYYRIRTQAS